MDHPVSFGNMHKGNEDQDAVVNCTLFISHLPDELTQEGLNNVLRKFGQVLSCCVRKDKTGNTIGFADMSSQIECSRAISALNGRPPLNWHVSLRRPPRVQQQIQQRQRMEHQFKEQVGDDQLRRLQELSRCDAETENAGRHFIECSEDSVNGSSHSYGDEATSVTTLSHETTRALTTDSLHSGGNNSSVAGGRRQLVYSAVVGCLSPQPCCVCATPTVGHCGKCRVARYCSRKCQLEHWVAHHQHCREPDYPPLINPEDEDRQMMSPSVENVASRAEPRDRVNQAPHRPASQNLSKPHHFEPNNQTVNAANFQHVKQDQRQQSHNFQQNHQTRNFQQDIQHQQQRSSQRENNQHYPQQKNMQQTHSFQQSTVQKQHQPSQCGFQQRQQSSHQLGNQRHAPKQNDSLGGSQHFRNQLEKRDDFIKPRATTGSGDNCTIKPLMATLVANADPIVLQVGTEHQVYVSHVVDAGNLYVQPCAHRQRYLRMEQQIQSAVSSSGASAPCSLQEGCLCAGLFQGNWFRCLVEATCDDHGRWLVRFIDWGNCCRLPADGLVRLTDEQFARLPALAVRVQLDGVVPDSRGRYTQHQMHAVTALQDRTVCLQVVAGVDENHHHLLVRLGGLAISSTGDGANTAPVEVSHKDTGVASLQLQSVSTSASPARQHNSQTDTNSPMSPVPDNLALLCGKACSNAQLVCVACEMIEENGGCWVPLVVLTSAVDAQAIMDTLDSLSTTCCAQAPLARSCVVGEVVAVQECADSWVRAVVLARLAGDRYRVFGVDMGCLYVVERVWSLPSAVSLCAYPPLVLAAVAADSDVAELRRVVEAAVAATEPALCVQLVAGRADAPRAAHVSLQQTPADTVRVHVLSCRQLLEGLVSADESHDRGVICSDIKPAETIVAAPENKSQFNWKLARCTSLASATLGIGDCGHQLLVASFQHPQLLSGQLVMPKMQSQDDVHSPLHHLLRQLNDSCSAARSCHQNDSVKNVSAGTLVAVLCRPPLPATGDQQEAWHRGRVMAVTDTTITVMLIDWAVENKVHARQLLPLPERFCQLEAFGVTVGLYDIEEHACPCDQLAFFRSKLIGRRFSIEIKCISQTGVPQAVLTSTDSPRAQFVVNTKMKHRIASATATTATPGVQKSPRSSVAQRGQTAAHEPCPSSPAVSAAVSSPRAGGDSDPPAMLNSVAPLLSQLPSASVLGVSVDAGVVPVIVVEVVGPATVVCNPLTDSFIDQLQRLEQLLANLGPPSERRLKPIVLSSCEHAANRLVMVAETVETDSTEPSWCRGCVMSCEQGEEWFIYLIDHGRVVVVNNSEAGSGPSQMYQVPAALLQVPALAVDLYVSDFDNLPERDASQLETRWQQLKTEGSAVEVQVVDYNADVSAFSVRVPTLSSMLKQQTM